MTYASIIRNAPIVVPAILVAGIIAVTLYRPHAVSTASGVASIVCADAFAKGIVQEKAAADATATDQASPRCP